MIEAMYLKEVERRYRELTKERKRGDLDEDRFRVEVAKLMFQDEAGVFWMIDADDGNWFCNRGEHWEPGDPHAEGVMAAPKPRTRRGRLLTLSIAVIVLVGLVTVLARQWPREVGPDAQAVATLPPEVEVIIAAPADGSQVALDQEVAVESTLNADQGLQAVDRVELWVDGESVGTQPVAAKLQPGQASLPLSQPWLPTTGGAHQVAVVALDAQGRPMGMITITLHVAEVSDETLPESACTPDAAFVADVTIPPGTAFRPGARMEKVWQVNNSGTCAWGVGYQLVRQGGEGLEAAGSVPVPPTAAGEPTDLAVTFVAPAAGAYTSTWQLSAPDGTPFGPMLVLSIEVEAQAEENVAPEAPTDLQATVTEDGEAIRLTWLDRSDNEDAFRVYRQDVEASIGLAPANAQLFVDGTVSCGNTYRYGVVAFNAAGLSPLVYVAETSLPPCATTDALPILALTVVPTQVLATETFTLTFAATDDTGLSQVLIRGEETGSPSLDAGRVFECSGTACAGDWALTLNLGTDEEAWTVEVTTTLTIAAIARDVAGQDSDPVQVQVVVVPAE